MVWLLLALSDEGELNLESEHRYVCRSVTFGEFLGFGIDFRTQGVFEGNCLLALMQER